MFRKTADTLHLRTWKIISHPLKGWAVIFFQNVWYKKGKKNSNFILCFVFGCVVYGILVPKTGIEPMPPAVEAQSLNHWTSREVSPN